MSKSKAPPRDTPAEQAVTDQAEEVKVEAGPCPQSERHKNTRVYRTVSRIRYCVCDDCGATWKRALPPA